MCLKLWIQASMFENNQILTFNVNCNFKRKLYTLEFIECKHCFNYHSYERKFMGKGDKQIQHQMNVPVHEPGIKLILRQIFLKQ